MAEHMLILGVENPEGKRLMLPELFQCLRKNKYGYVGAPDSMKGWKVSTVGDDIAWLKPDKVVLCVR